MARIDSLPTPGMAIGRCLHGVCPAGHLIKSQVSEIGGMDCLGSCCETTTLEEACNAKR